MNKLIRKGGVFPLFALSVAFLLQSCGNPGMNGADILPDKDDIGVFLADSFSCEMRVIFPDSNLTGPLVQTMFGVCDDPEFGTLASEAFVQFLATGSNINFGDSGHHTFDSLVLFLNLSGVYGRYDQPQTLQVHEIDDDLFNRDSAHYASDFLNVQGIELSHGFKMDFSAYAGYFDFGFKLDSTLGNKLLNCPTATLNDPALFRQYFNGLRLSTLGFNGLSREEGAVFYFETDPDQRNTKLTLYFHQDSTPRSYDFFINGNAGCFSHVVRNNQNSALLGYETQQSPAKEYAFVQAGNSVKTFISFPWIDSLPPMVIHSARMEVPVDATLLGSLNRFEPPETLYAFLADSTGQKELKPLTYTRAVYSGAAGMYAFELNKFIMDIRAGKLPNNGWILSPDKSGSTMNRAVLGGPQNPSHKPRLKILYSTLPGL